jgi:nucleoside-diphosphate-sugar epimerase
MKNNKKLLITGASGFVGKHLVPVFYQKYKVETVSLQKKTVGELALKDIEVIVHLAGKAHQMTKIDDEIYFQVNRDLTIQLAKKAKLEGVGQFVFISTVKVFGDNNTNTLNENSPCYPTDPYGQSKLEAEEGLKKLETEDFKITIIRPPLIYGKAVKGNLERLIGLIKKIPILPFGGIKNQRSMVYVNNLIALIDHIIQKQSSGIFIAGDKNTHSTTELVKLIDKYLNTNRMIIRIPLIILYFLKKVKPALISRLFASYIIDNNITNQRLKFVPPFSFEEGIKDMTEGFEK